MSVFSTEQVNVLALLFIELQEVGVNIAQIFWGLWLLPLGYLVFKSQFLPRLIGVLLVIAGVGYVIDSFAFFLIPDAGVAVSQFTFIGELLLAGWLLIKGVNVKQWEARANKSAEPVLSAVGIVS